jgi:exodeoxyribonuclease VII large subunit
VAPAAEALFHEISSRRVHLERLLKQHLEIRRLKVGRIESVAVFREPSRLILERQQRVDQLEIRIVQFRDWLLKQRREHLLRLTSLVMMFKPAEVLERRRKEITLFQEKLRSTMRQQFERERHHLRRLSESIRLLGPEQTLRRGYSITEDESGKVIQSVSAVAANQKLKTILTDGSIWSTTDG